MNLVELLDQAARAAPGTPAFIDGPAGRERITTYADLETRSRRLATLFAGAGLRAGDGVAVMLPMSAALYAVIAAAWRLGLVPVFMDPAAGGRRLAEYARRYPLSAFVGTPAACLLRLATRALREIPAAFVAGPCFPGARSLRAARRLPPHGETHPCTDDSPAMVAFTSGSTGRPKGMLRTHGLLRATHAVLSAHVRPGRGEVALATLPVFTLSNLACGATSLIPDVDLRRPGAADPGRLAGQLERWQARSAVASPALLERVADYCLQHGHRLDGLREIFVGGAPVFPGLLEKLRRAAPRAGVRVLYGSTEAEPIALVPDVELGEAEMAQMVQGGGLLVGRPIPEIKLRILRETGAPSPPGEPEEAAPGQPGEIVVAGPHVVPGYLGGEGDGETKLAMAERTWHRTGDAGRIDGQGRLWLLGRCSARIEDCRGILYPYAVEAGLSCHPGIARSAFLSHGGKRLLVLEPRRGAAVDVPDLLGPLAWAGVEAVVLVRRLPVDARHNAKVDYPALRRLLDRGRWLRRVEVRG